MDFLHQHQNDIEVKIFRLHAFVRSFFLPFVNFYWQQISLQAYLAIHSFGNLVIHPSPYSQKVGSVTTFHYNYNFVTFVHTKGRWRHKNVWFFGKIPKGWGSFSIQRESKAVWNFSENSSVKAAPPVPDLEKWFMFVSFNLDAARWLLGVKDDISSCKTIYK